MTTPDSRRLHSESIRDVLQTFPFGTKTARVIKVQRHHFSGHVYNLQTSSGAYVAEGIITHNCRCFYRWIYALRDLPSDMLTKKGRDALEQARAEIAA